MERDASHLFSSKTKLLGPLLLLGRKAMTNIDSILKGRDITLQTKVHIVKAVVFLVVVYGCDVRVGL